MRELRTYRGALLNVLCQWPLYEGARRDVWLVLERHPDERLGVRLVSWLRDRDTPFDIPLPAGAIDALIAALADARRRCVDEMGPGATAAAALNRPRGGRRR